MEPNTQLVDISPVDVACPEGILSTPEESARERRREPRYPTDKLTFLHLTGTAAPERIFCRVLDVSESGMRLRTERAIDPGTEIRVTLREMFAVASVRYCRAVTDGFDHGVQVAEIRNGAPVGD